MSPRRKLTSAGLPRFDQHQIGVVAQTRKTIRDESHHLRLEGLIVARLGGSENPALHHNLRADLALRFSSTGFM